MAAKHFVNIGFAGMLNASNAINQSHVFAGMLDSQTYSDYPRNVSDKRSIPFDLRYAIENFTTLGDVAAYMSSPAHIYAMNNIIVVADRNTAGVIENDMNDVLNPNRSLRVDTSAFNPRVIIDGLSWPRQNWTQTGDFWSGANDYLRNVVASVNDFRLPGNYFLPNDDYNRARWESYRACFANALGNTPDAQCTVINSRTKIGVDQMKRIVGYTGPGPAASDLG